MNKIISLKCPAKINLSLDVIRRRDDGYHDLEMIMHTINLFDILTFELKPSDEVKIQLSTNLGFLPTGEKNLCYKAAKLFFEKTHQTCDLKIQIKKTIPVGAGLGGGSSDAAGTLAALNYLFGRPLTKTELAATAKSLGADVPFFLYGDCMLAKGIGDILLPLPPLSDAIFVIAKPSYGISTPLVYKNLQLNETTPHPDTDAAIEALKANDLVALGKASGNVLETVVEKDHPEISQYKNIMLECGAVYSLMSGSGSSVFGVFNNKNTAKLAVASLKKLTQQVYIA
jgi:4-diphosphocytidyl-2-C-methyl-D-erythritol kinase